MIPRFDLQFDAPAVGYDGARDVAFCNAQAGVETIRCASSREALEDHFGAAGEEPGSVLIGTEDVAALLRTPRRRA
ncbi:MAG TPA: DUF1488 family protein [Acetobacteraceae bacterium]